MKEIRAKIEKERERLIEKIREKGICQDEEELNSLSLLDLAELAGELK